MVPREDARIETRRQRSQVFDGERMKRQQLVPSSLVRVCLGEGRPRFQVDILALQLQRLPDTPTRHVKQNEKPSPPIHGRDVRNVARHGRDFAGLEHRREVFRRDVGRELLLWLQEPHPRNLVDETPVRRQSQSRLGVPQLAVDGRE